MLVAEGGRGTFRNNEIFANTLSGIIVTSEADPLIECNRVRENAESGITISDSGRGSIHRNEVWPLVALTGSVLIGGSGEGVKA